MASSLNTTWHSRSQSSSIEIRNSPVNLDCLSSPETPRTICSMWLIVSVILTFNSRLLHTVYLLRLRKDLARAGSAVSSIALGLLGLLLPHKHPVPENSEILFLPGGSLRNLFLNKCCIDVTDLSHRPHKILHLFHLVSVLWLHAPNAPRGDFRNFLQ